MWISSRLDAQRINSYAADTFKADQIQSSLLRSLLQSNDRFGGRLHFHLAEA